MTHVYIAQMLCPERHCLIATAGEYEEGQQHVLEAIVRDATEAGIASGQFNPVCALCGAERATWRVELARTKYGSMEEALPCVAGEQIVQRLLGITAQRLGLGYEELKARLKSAQGAKNN